MNRKKIFIITIAVAIIGGGWYGYAEYNRKVKNLGNVKAELYISTVDLIHAFEKNETGANKLYLDKIIAVTGMVKAVEKNNNGHYSVVLGEGTDMASVRCSMDSSHVSAVLSLTNGSRVTIKGACTGFNADELLGSDVILNRCVLEK